jgi:hypothetical protein
MVDAGARQVRASVHSPAGLTDSRTDGRFLLYEDLSPRVAEVGRGLGVDVESVHELDRRGLSDREQLRLAAAETRIFVTRNRDDYIVLTVEFYGTGEPHNGLLIVPRGPTSNRPERISHTLKRWVDARHHARSVRFLPSGLPLPIAGTAGEAHTTGG